MTFETYTPKEPLTPLIDSLMFFEGYNPSHSKERVVPTGHIHLLIELDDIPRHVYDDDLNPSQTHEGAWVSGMHRRHLNIYAPPQSSMFVVRFGHIGSYPILHIPTHTLNDRLVDAKDIFGESATIFRKKMRSADSPSEKFRLAEDWLFSRFKSDYRPPKAIEELVATLVSSPAGKLKDIIDSYPHSQKSLIAQFKKYVGHTPKYFQRILRFNDILNQINRNRHIKWSDIAYQTGFSDQSHFIKEFKHFSGFNPNEFIEKDFDGRDENFFPLDLPG